MWVPEEPATRLPASIRWSPRARPLCPDAHRVHKPEAAWAIIVGVSQLPALHELMKAPDGRPVRGFTTSGDEAVVWWQRLRDAHPETGLWPVLMDDEAPEYLVDAYSYEDLAASQARVATLDGAALLAGSHAANLKIYGPELTAEIAAELNGEGDWPDDPERRGSGFFGSEPALVARPPATRAGALTLAWEYRAYNDGAYDFYFADTMTQLAASLHGALVWRMWWD